MGCNQIVSKSSEMDVLETFHLIAQHLNPWFCWAVFFSESQEKFEGQTYFFSDRNATVASFGETRARQKGVWLGPSIDTSHHNDSIDKDPADIAGVVVNEMPLLDAPPPPPPQINRHVGRWTTNFLYYTACVWVRGCVFFFALSMWWIYWVLFRFIWSDWLLLGLTGIIAVHAADWRVSLFLICFLT